MKYKRGSILIEVKNPYNSKTIIEKNGKRIILDAYNANPTSMKLALENFNEFSGNHKIAFLGDMFELGETAKIEHQYIADLASGLNLEKAYLIGENFNKTSTTLQKFRTYKDVTTYLKDESFPKDCSILIKGSRGMALERLLEVL